MVDKEIQEALPNYQYNSKEQILKDGHVMFAQDVCKDLFWNQKKLRKAEAEISAITAHRNALKEVIKTANSQIKDQEAENKLLTVNRDDYKKMYINAEQRVEEHIDNSARMANELHNSEAEIKELREELETVRTINNNQKDVIDTYEAEIKELKKQLLSRGMK